MLPHNSLTESASLVDCRNTQKFLGPIILSALSFSISFFIMQEIAFFIDPQLSLLARGGIGKIIFTSMVFLQLILFFAIQSKEFLLSFFKTTILFFTNKKWLKPFFILGTVFFILHSILIIFLWNHGSMIINPDWHGITKGILLQLLLAFTAVFTLAWSEEAIFRGGIYPYFAQWINPFPAAIVTSVIFSLAHNISNPLKLCSTDLALGIGLFLLGLLLNLLFIKTGKLYIGMGAHAGLVAVKVFLRKAPFLIFKPIDLLPFWIHPDLRQSYIVHIFFLLFCIILYVSIKKNLYNKK